MSYFYKRDGEIYIPDRINPDLVKLAKAIIKTCRLSFKHQMKIGALNAALKSGKKEQMYDIMQKCFEKNKALYNSDMSLTGAEITEVEDNFFADKDTEFYVGQLNILLDFAAINTVIECKVFPLMSAAAEKTVGKKLSDMLFFMNQGEIRRQPEEETPDAQ